MAPITGRMKAWGTAGEDKLPFLSPWDVVTIANTKRLPGVARVSGRGVEHKLDVKKTPGKDGAVFSDLGRELANFTVTLTLQSATEWEDFKKIVPALQPLNQTGKLEAITISHPALNALGIAASYCQRVGIPHPGSVVGTYEVELEFLEYRPPKGSKDGGVGTPTKDVKDWEGSGDGYPPKPKSEKATKPSKVNTGP